MGEKYMKKILFTILTIILFTCFVTTNVAGADEITATSHSIVITTQQDSLLFEEQIEMLGTSDEYYETVDFCISDGAQNINILLNNNPIESPEINGNIYTYNITDLNLRMNQTLVVTLAYTLPKSTTEMQKITIYKTDEISVSFDENENLYKSKNLPVNAEFNLKLYKPTETPLSLYMIGIIILLLILLSVTAFYSFKKQKTTKKPSKGVESEELLSTKKILLMNLLKEVEKQHRAGKLSDDTYHKIKDQYKNEAVDTMKKLEEGKSKIK